jgi:hypothetical protein
VPSTRANEAESLVGVFDLRCVAGAKPGSG